MAMTQEMQQKEKRPVEVTIGKGFGGFFDFV
jgi:hypothetical protein